MRDAALRSILKQKGKAAFLVKISDTDIGSIMQLTEVDLNDKSLTALPAEICYLTKATRLYLSFNRLTELPFSRLTGLTGVNLSFNQLTEPPKGFGRLTGLKFLDLSGNPFRTPPAALASSLRAKGVKVICNRNETPQDLP